jgi:hypothetical protein
MIAMSAMHDVAFCSVLILCRVQEEVAGKLAEMKIRPDLIDASATRDGSIGVFYLLEHRFAVGPPYTLARVRLVDRLQHSEQTCGDGVAAVEDIGPLRICLLDEAESGGPNHAAAINVPAK